MKETTVKNLQIVTLTPEYLYEEGIKYYNQASLLKEKNEQQEIYIKSILYFQGAMILGSKDACEFLKKSYNKKNNFEINAPDLSNLITIVQKYYIENLKLDNISEFSKSTNITLVANAQIIINTKIEYLNNTTPECLVLNNIKCMIEAINKKVLPKYRLIADEIDFECRKNPMEFTNLEIRESIHQNSENAKKFESEQVTHIKVPEYQYIKSFHNDDTDIKCNKIDDYDLINAATNCTIS